jgi:hypothetical protein
LEFVNPASLPGTSSKETSKEKLVGERESLEESEIPQEGYPSSSCKDESTESPKNMPLNADSTLVEEQKDTDLIGTPEKILKKIKNLASGTGKSSFKGQHELHSSVKMLSTTLRDSKFIQKDDPGSVNVSNKQVAEDKVAAQLSSDDPLKEPNLLQSYTQGKTNFICDPAPCNWVEKDSAKCHQVELQALLGGPLPRHIQECI